MNYLFNLLRRESRRFSVKVDKNGPIPLHAAYLGRCWVWKSSKWGKEYGGFTIRGRFYFAHRIAYSIHNEVDLSSSQLVCHKCDNPICVRPSHLFLGTPVSNMEDRDRKGRHHAPSGDQHGLRLHPERVSRGQKHYLSKLDDSKVRKMRARYIRGVFGCVRLAREFGVNVETVRSVVLRKTWKHVT